MELDQQLFAFLSGRYYRIASKPLDRYDILAWAEDAQTNTRVLALRTVLHRELGGHPQDRLQALIRQNNALPSSLPILDVAESSPTNAIVLERHRELFLLLDQTKLTPIADYFEGLGWFDEDIGIKVLRSLADALLEHRQELGVIHLMFGNSDFDVWLQDDLRVRLVPNYLAKIEPSHHPDITDCGYIPNYGFEFLSLEQIQGIRNLSETSLVHRFAHYAFYLFTHATYYPRDLPTIELMKRMLLSPYVPPSEVVKARGLPELPGWFDDWFAACIQTQERPGQRSLRTAVNQLGQPIQSLETPSVVASNNDTQKESPPENERPADVRNESEEKSGSWTRRKILAVVVITVLVMLSVLGYLRLR